MKTSLGLAFLLGCSLNASGALVWVGSAGGFGGDNVSLYQEANWDLDGGGAPAAGTVDANSAITSDVVITGGNPGGPGSGANGGGNFTLDAAASLAVSGSGFLNIRANQASNNRGIAANSAPITIADSGTVRAQFITNSAVSMSGASTLTVAGGGNPINGVTIALTSDWTGSVNFLNEDVTAATSEHLGKFTVGGAAAVVGTNVEIVTDGGSGSILTVIPEPSVALLGAFGFLQLLRRRR